MEPFHALLCLLLILIATRSLPLLIIIASIFFLLTRHRHQADEETQNPGPERNGWETSDTTDDGWGAPIFTPWDQPTPGITGWQSTYEWTRQDIRNAYRPYDPYDDWMVGEDSPQSWDPTDAPALLRLALFRRMPFAYSTLESPALQRRFHTIVDQALYLKSIKKRQE